MIKNGKQYRLTQTQVEKFETALAVLRASADSTVHPLLRQAEEQGLEQQLSSLREELSEYDLLTSGNYVVPEVQVLEELPITLVRARIARRMTTGELAALVGLDEDQLNTFEETGYSLAGAAILRQLTAALGVVVSEEVIHAADVGPRTFFSRLKNIGLDRTFILDRLLPSALADDLRQREHDGSPALIAGKAASVVARVFGWSPGEVLFSSALSFNPIAAGTARFKMPANVAQKCVTSYTVYAHYLALVLLQATANLPTRDVPTDARVVRTSILQNYGALTLENVLNYVWDLGIPVLPLRDAGGFHGACWRSQGRNVIVLKQQTSSSARVMFDLLHELRHAAESPNENELTVLEDSETSKERRNAMEEQVANQFAGDVVLDSRAEELAKRCVAEAQGRLEWLKGSAQKVASAEGVPVDSLANYLAYRLAMQGTNWWGAAHNLQRPDSHPWRIARDILFQRVDFSHMIDRDRELLVQSLAVGG